MVLLSISALVQAAIQQFAPDAVEESEIDSQMAEPVPQEIMDKLLKIPYFAAGYDEDGIKIDDFINHPSFVATRNEFSGSMKEIEEHVLARMKK